MSDDPYRTLGELHGRANAPPPSDDGDLKFHTLEAGFTEQHVWLKAVCACLSCPGINNVNAMQAADKVVRGYRKRGGG